MRWIKTIRFRFALWATAILLGMLAAFGGFVYLSLSHSLRSALDDSLSLSAAQTAATLNVENGHILIPEPITPDESGFQAFSQRGLTLIVLAQDGTILQSAGRLRASPVPVDVIGRQAEFRTLPANRESQPTRVYILPVLDNSRVVGWVQAMQNLGDVQDSLDRLLAALLLGGGLLSIVTAFAGYLLAARALAPIDSITRTARRISTEDLTARLNLTDTGDEISRLAATFDEMLARIESGFRHERQFTSDASHELRTPLAAMQAILSVVREGERPVQDYRQALDDLAGETDRLRGLVEDLLSLARGDRQGIAPRAPVDLSTLLVDVTDSLRPLAEAKGLSLTCETPAGLALMADSDSLIRLFVNLLDNAIKYTYDGAVTVSASRDAESLCIEIADSGPGIASEHLAHIFDRFYRAEAARSSSGSGLGLAIARQIAQTHGGTITAQSVLGQGTTVVVRFPT